MLQRRLSNCLIGHSVGTLLSCNLSSTTDICFEENISPLLMQKKTRSMMQTVTVWLNFYRWNQQRVSLTGNRNFRPSIKLKKPKCAESMWIIYIKFGSYVRKRCLLEAAKYYCNQLNIAKVIKVSLSGRFYPDTVYVCMYMYKIKSEEYTSILM